MTIFCQEKKGADLTKKGADMTNSRKSWPDTHTDSNSNVSLIFLFSGNLLHLCYMFDCYKIRENTNSAPLFTPFGGAN